MPTLSGQPQCFPLLLMLRIKQFMTKACRQHEVRWIDMSLRCQTHILLLEHLWNYSFCNCSPQRHSWSANNGPQISSILILVLDGKRQSLTKWNVLTQIHRIMNFGSSLRRFFTGAAAVVGVAAALACCSSWRCETRKFEVLAAQ